MTLKSSMFFDANWRGSQRPKVLASRNRKLLYFINSWYVLMTHIVKIIELIGSSEKGWTEAAQSALDEAKKTIKGITGLEVNDITAKVDPSSGKITQYRVGVKIAFTVEHS